ncbi:MAG: hypothetical protein PHN82_01995 [bacterium]|nr:hypothetical protein [bacterium]
MTDTRPSPFARPWPGLPVRKGSPPIHMPTVEEASSYPADAERLLDGIRAAQGRAARDGAYRLDWIEGRHFLVAGGTGSGLGGCVAAALLDRIGPAGSLTVVSRDPSRSVAYETGALMQARAAAGGRFHWLNYGVAIEGRKFGNILTALREASADRVIYVNTVAAAHSGLLPGHPPVYVKDCDEEGLFQWQLLPLLEGAVETTRSAMGALAAAFPRRLEEAGVGIEATVFSDWRGSLDFASRDPSSPAYGRQGPYSTSLYLPKDIVREETARAIGTGRVVIDAFLPVMHTRALSLIPGGRLLYGLFGTLMEREGVRRVETPELALGLLDRVGRALGGRPANPFPRLDMHEAQLDLWFVEVLTRLGNDPASDFHYLKWL